tara:strand:+ start:1082 stop:1627 length:546 start_codon:yes stop_codon:yes gene_type:complete
MKIFLTADTFFSKPDALNLGNRLEHFVSVDQMDETLIENWNEVITDDDVVYHLGNFCWDPMNGETILRRLNGRIKFYLGQYDKTLIDIIPQFDGYHTIVKDQITYDPKNKSVFSHWPLLNWPNKSKGSIQFHGNGIGMKPMNFEEEFRVNCSIDNWKFYPVEIVTILDIMKDVSEIKNDKK